MSHAALRKAVALVGGQVQLAKALGPPVRQAHVWKWLNKTRLGAPAEFCRAIERATGGQVTRYELRPDVFGTPETDALASRCQRGGREAGRAA